MEDSGEEDLIGFFMADLEALLEEVAHQLHELVDAVVVDEIPLGMQVGEEGRQEGEGVLLGDLVQDVGDLGG